MEKKLDEIYGHEALKKLDFTLYLLAVLLGPSHSCVHVFAGGELATGSLWQVAVGAQGSFACFCPAEAEGSAVQPHEGADASDKRGGCTCADAVVVH